MKMSRPLLCLVAMSIAISGFAIAEQNSHFKKQDYKCYLETTLGYQMAFFGRWKENEVQLQMAKLIAKKLPGEGGYIKSVEECVGMNEVFTLDGAQKLDEITLR